MRPIPSNRPGPPHAVGDARSWRFAYQPALDGVRALAILAVIAFHTGARAFGSGFYGVDVFFVLSGFLITTLLLQERAATGTISLRLFWGRRTARLLPALLVVCGLVAIISVVNAVVAVRPQAGSARLALAQGG